MKSIFRLIVLVLLLGGWALAAAAMHIVRSPEGIVPVGKDRLSFHDTYVDTRKWMPADVDQHPALVHRLQEAGRTDAIKHAWNPTTQPAIGPGLAKP